MIDKLSPSLLLAFGASGIFSRHRVIPKNVPVAKRFLKAALKRERSPNDLLTEILRLEKRSLLPEVICLLSEETLTEAFPDLLIHFGAADVLAASLLDTRPGVRNLAEEGLETLAQEPSEQIDYESSSANLQAKFGSLINSLHTRGQESNDQVPAADPLQPPTDSEKLPQQLQKAKSDQERITRRASAERSKLGAKIQSQEKQIGALQASLLAAGEETKALRSEISRLTEDYDQLRISLQQRIDDGVSEGLSHHLRKWLEPICDIESALAIVSNSDLVERANLALARQREVDRNYGNRSELALLLKERRDLLARIREAQSHALRPLEDLPTIAAELEQEIDNISRRLDICHAPTRLAGQLLARINAANCPESLLSIKRFMENASDYSVLSEKESRQLLSQIEQATSRIYDQYKLSRVDRRGVFGPSLVREAAIHGRAVIIILDGHNVLHALSELFSDYFVDGQPKTEARRELANSIANVFVRPGPEVLLFFDGEHAKVVSLNAQVRAIYSGGKGDQRADRAIVEQLHFYSRSESDTPICLVTLDNKLAQDASKEGVKIVAPEEFAVSIGLRSIRSPVDA